jgi:hypothetical protein
MAPDEIMSVFEKAEAKREELLSLQPEVKRTEKILHALPAAAKQYRDQIKKGLSGDPNEAGLARIAVRQLLGEEITLKPAKGRTDLVAHWRFHRAALLGRQIAESRFGGSGGVIWPVPTIPQSARLK